MKKLLTLIILTQLAAAMDREVAGHGMMAGPRSQSLLLTEDNLARSFQASQMQWVPQMYEASGLQSQMSRECFMVNALKCIKESIDKTRCCPGLQECMADVKECLPPTKTCVNGLVAATSTISGMGLLVTFLMGLSANIPGNFPENQKNSACMLAELIFNYAQGVEWAGNCFEQSMATDFPCNVTAAREEYIKTGTYYETSECCYDKANPVCYQKGLEYNRNVYPGLHSQAVWNAWKPFMIAVPTVAAVTALQLGILVVRRYVRERAKAQAEQVLVAVEEV